MRILFSFILFYFLSIPLSASHLSKEELADIESTCLISSPACLVHLEEGLNSSEPRSRQWFRFKQLRLINLFDLQKWELLKKEVNVWLLDEKMPPNFAVYVYIYHAKLHANDKSTQEFSFYLTKATNLLSEINSKSFSPLRLIEIANLQISHRKYAQAKETLLQLEIQFSQRDYPIFKQELYANLGHIALVEKKYNEHVQYRLKSLTSTLKTDNAQQISIAYTNLAYAFQLVKDYKKSKENYELSIKYSEKSLDDNTTIRSKMRLVQVLLLLNEKVEAEKIFTKLSTTFTYQVTSKSNLPLYQELKTALSIKD